MNKPHHKITALILSLSMILSITPFSFAETITMEEKAQIQTPVKTGMENLISTKDNSNLNVAVIREKDDITETIYHGRLGDYEDGKYSYIDFDNLDVLFVWNVSDDSTVTITPAMQYETMTTDYVSFNGSYVYHDGEYYTERKLSENTNFEVTFQNGLYGNNKSFCSILAVYDNDGILKSINKSEEIIVGQNTTATVTATLNTKELSDTDIIKAMIWDMNTMTPYINSQIILEDSTDSYGNTRETATLINDISKEITGDINSSGDIDCFKIKAPKSGRYYIRCFSNDNISYNAYNPDSMLSHHPEDGVLEFVMPEDRYFYVTVKAGGIRKYNLSIQYGDSYSENFDIYELDKELSISKESINNIAKEIYDISPDIAKEMYVEYEQIAERDAKLHKLPYFLEGHPKELSNFDKLLNSYYGLKYDKFNQLVSDYIALIDEYAEIRKILSDMEPYSETNEVRVIGSEFVTPVFENPYYEETDENELETIADNTPSFEIIEATQSRIRFTLTYPQSQRQGNTLSLLNFNTGDGITEYSLMKPGSNISITALKNGTYTITNSDIDLEPNGIYVLSMMWSDNGGRTYGGENSINRFIQIPDSTQEIRTIYTYKENGVVDADKRVIANVEENVKELASDADFNKWLLRMNNVYDSLKELTGYTPYKYEQITMQSEKENLNRELNVIDGANYSFVIFGVAGQVFRMTHSYYKGLMRRLEEGDWGETPIHELSHAFDNENWNFDAETLAQLKTVYAIERLGAKVYFPCFDYYIDNETPGTTGAWYYGKVSTGSTNKQYRKLLKTDRYRDSYNDAFTERQTYSSEGFASILLDIQDEIGWEPFKKTFRFFNELEVEEVPLYEIGILNLFLSKLKEYSGTDVFSLIKASDKEIIEEYYGGTLTEVDDEDKTINITTSGRRINIDLGKGEYRVFRFTPPQTANYKIYTSNQSETSVSNDTYIEVHSESDLSDTPILMNDDYANGRFSSVSTVFEDGETYYIKVRNYNSSSNITHATLNVVKVTNNSVLEIGEEKNASVYESGFETYEFTPDKSGVYTFYADNTDDDTYLKLYSTADLTQRVAQHNNTIITWLNAGQTYYLQFSGFLMQSASADVGVRRGETIEFTKSADSNFIYVNNPEFITNYDIVDDANSERRKIFEQKNVAEKNTFYETHLAWYGNGYFPTNNFYYDVDFYNPTDEEISINILNLAYVTSQNTYEDLQKYLNGTGININFTLSPGKHKLLFKDILNSPYCLIDVGIQTEAWDRAKALTVLFDFVVNNGNVTVSSLAAYDVDNLVFSDNSNNMLKDTGYVLNSGDVIHEYRPNEGDIEQKYKGIALNQSSWIISNIDILIDKHRASEYDVGLNLYEPFYQDVIKDYTKTKWETNVNPLYDDTEGVHLAIPSNLHSFIYGYNGNRYWNFDFQHYDLSVLNLGGGIEESVNSPIPDSTMDKLKALVKSGVENKAQVEPNSLGMGSWGVPYRYIITVNNADNKDRIVEFKVKGLSETVLGYRATDNEAYETVYNPKSEEEWYTYKSIEVPKGTVKTFEIVTMLACGDGGQYNKITVKTK